MSGSATSALPRERSLSASHRAYVARLATPSASAPPEGVPAEIGGGLRPSIVRSRVNNPGSARGPAALARWHIDGTGRRPPTIDDDHRPKLFLQVSELLGGSPQAGRRGHAVPTEQHLLAPDVAREGGQPPRPEQPTPGRSRPPTTERRRPVRTGADLTDGPDHRLPDGRVDGRPRDPGGPRSRPRRPQIIAPMRAAMSASCCW
jgi:hypothetical protein